MLEVFKAVKMLPLKCFKAAKHQKGSSPVLDELIIHENDMKIRWILTAPMKNLNPILSLVRSWKQQLTTKTIFFTKSLENDSPHLSPIICSNGQILTIMDHLLSEVSFLTLLFMFVVKQEQTIWRVSAWSDFWAWNLFCFFDK